MTGGDGGVAMAGGDGDVYGSNLATVIVIIIADSGAGHRQFEPV